LILGFEWCLCGWGYPRNTFKALVELGGSDRGVAEAPGAIGDAPQLAHLTRTPHRESPRKVDKAGGGDNPEGATDTRVGNSSRALGGRLGMGDSAAASEGGDDEAALQAQRKRPRTSSNGEVALVRQRLLACAFPGVQNDTTVPKLKGLLFEHGLAMRLVCPEPELRKANGTPAESKWHGVHVACAWIACLFVQMAQPAGAPSCSPPFFSRSGEPKAEHARWLDASAAAWRDVLTLPGWKDRETALILPITDGQRAADVLEVPSSSLQPWTEDHDRATPAKLRSPPAKAPASQHIHRRSRDNASSRDQAPDALLAELILIAPRTRGARSRASVFPPAQSGRPGRRTAALRPFFFEQVPAQHWSSDQAG
jgi:hypothetical protein